MDTYYFKTVSLPLKNGTELDAELLIFKSSYHREPYKYFISMIDANGKCYSQKSKRNAMFYDLINSIIPTLERVMIRRNESLNEFELYDGQSGVNLATLVSSWQLDFVNTCHLAIWAKERLEIPLLLK